ncbi:MAG: FGE-sulfatase protein [Magnetococcales bacterium]|nr:FGE-sulfatase protein [Magnetococcales bacterium]HIJ83191.1 SUMF1/EgtB/PvdO family nonheme iron enzyme [Magnetococcales bacterium]
MKKGLILAGRYTLHKELGQGLFGDAFLAHDEGTGLDVTVKTLTQRVSRDERTLSDVRRNFQLLQNLDHPHIVKVHALEFDALTQAHFLVREYVEGVTLTEHRMRCSGGMVSVAEALDICRQIAMALDHAHRSLLHRDLKPNNILISQSGEVKLLNFCLVPEQLAKEIRSESLRRDLEFVSQTHGFMAPEQFFGFPPPGPAADRYALAAVFYELVSGRPPFDHPDPQALMHAVCNMAPPIIREVGKRRNRLISQAMSKDPGKRFLSAMAFVDAMEASPLSLLTQYAGPLGATLAALVVTAGVGWFLSGHLDGTAERSGIETSIQETGQGDAAMMGGSQEQTVMLRVESRPGGAQVTLDGKKLGITPLSVGQVLRGRYALKLEKVGYGDVVVDMELAEDTVVDLSLDALLPSGSQVASGLSENSGEKDSGKEGATQSASQDGVENGGNPRDDQEVVRLPGPPVSDSQPVSDTAATLVSNDPNASVTEIQPEPLPLPPPLRVQQRSKEASLQVETAGETAATTPAGSVVDAERVSERLKDAAKHFRAMRLTFPKGNNALENFREALAMDPDNAEAQEGIRHIAARLLDLAQEDIDEGRLAQPEGRNALAKVTLAGELDPANPKTVLSLKKIAEKYILLAQKASENGDRAMVEARLAQAKAVAPEDPLVAQAYQKLLNSEGVGVKKQDQPVVATGESSNVAQVGVSEEGEKAGQAPPAGVPSMPEMIERRAAEVKGTSVAGSVWKDPVTGMEFVEISDGCFSMGTDYGDPDESPVHPVCLDRYRISKLEVTQGVWKKIMGSDNNPSKFNQDDRLPVDSISWTMAMEFIQRLNEKSSVAFRLPSEAEWENACRAGKSEPYQSGTSIQTSQANFNGSQPLPGEEAGIFRRTTVAAGSFSPNRFGLYDMHGNVYEWVEDWYVKDYYGKSPERNPLAADDTSYLHVLRGGAWHSNSGNLRCGYRYRGRPDFNNFGNGFRLASSHTGG